MSRESLGIILNGDSRQIQEQKLWLKVMALVCRFIWIPTLIATVVVLVMSLVQNSGKLLAMGGKLALLTAAFGILCQIWGEYVRCPYCHHIGTMKKFGGEKAVGSYSREITRNVTDYHSGMAYDLKGNSAFVSGRTTYKESGTETTTRYTYNMRCTICGCVNKVDKENKVKKF